MFIAFLCAARKHVLLPLLLFSSPVYLPRQTALFNVFFLLGDRFYGKSMFYTNNELRWIADVRSYLLNGKFGLLPCWITGRYGTLAQIQPTHTGYGGGILLAPFNLFSTTVTYAVSERQSLFSIRFIRPLKK